MGLVIPRQPCSHAGPVGSLSTSAHFPDMKSQARADYPNGSRPFLSSHVEVPGPVLLLAVCASDFTV